MIQIGNNAFSGKSEITTVNFEEPSNVQTIGNSAFSGCTGISQISIPSSVTQIGSGAFWGNSNLTTVIFNGLTQIGVDAFTGFNRTFKFPAQYESYYLQYLDVFFTLPLINWNPVTALPSGTRSNGYSATIAAASADSAVTYALVAGALPAGLTFNPATRTVSGIITGSAGTYRFTVQAQASGYKAKNAEFTIVVINNAGGVPSDWSGYEIYYGQVDLYASISTDGKFVFFTSVSGDYVLEVFKRGGGGSIIIYVFDASFSLTEVVYYFEEDDIIFETIYLNAGYYLFQVNDEYDYGAFVLMLY